MIVHLSGEVCYEMLNTLTKAYNDIKNSEEILTVYITTEGGLTDVAEAIIDFINNNCSKMELVFYGEVFSSGMFIFLRTTCTKRILPDTRGMYHYAWQNITISEGGKPSSDYDIFCMKEMKKSKIRTLENLKSTKLTEREVNDIKKGKDVYFSHDRMLQLIDGTK